VFYIIFHKTKEAVFVTEHKVNPMLNVYSMYSCFEPRYKDDFYYPGESHNFWELVYVIDGNVGVSADDRVYALKENDIIFHKPMEYHKLWTPVGKESHLFICSFSASGSAAEELENGVFRLNYEQRNELINLIEYIRMENSDLPRTNKRDLEPWDKSPYFSAIVAKRLELIMMMIIENSKRVRPVQDNKDVKLYNFIIKHLEKNIANQISVPDIADKFSISVSKLNKLFASYAGCGVHTYHIKMKIQKAVKLLNTDIPANVISDMLGFNNPNYFSLTFKRETGFSPQNYKKRFMKK
jgi:AraC-like DNA-binding protein